jgi:hypothetical protein
VRSRHRASNQEDDEVGREGIPKLLVKRSERRRARVQAAGDGTIPIGSLAMAGGAVANILGARAARLLFGPGSRCQHKQNHDRSEECFHDVSLGGITRGSPIRAEAFTVRADSARDPRTCGGLPEHCTFERSQDYLATDQVQAVRFNKRTGAQQVDSIRRIGGLRRLLPGLHLLVGHDHTDCQASYLGPYLAKGWLSDEERRALSEYESSLFGPDGALRPAALPRFEPGANGAAVGTVNEP